jgi:hypothetical protein
MIFCCAGSYATMFRLKQRGLQHRAFGWQGSCKAGWLI